MTDEIPGAGAPSRFSAIPKELRERNQWVNWRTEIRNGRPTKVPLNPRTEGRASTTDASTWDTYEAAVEASEWGQIEGLGFVFTTEDKYVGIDLDRCRDPKTGAVQPWAEQIIVRLASYTEVSPSGSGVHIIVRGALPPGGRKRGDIEMYDRGRYFTMTGARLPDAPQDVHDRTEELEALHREIFGSPVEEAVTPRAIHHDLTDDELIARASGAANGAKFTALWSSNTGGYASQSEADLALCSLLCYWTGPDQSRVDRLFRRSGLMRPKWDERRGEQTYGQLTVLRALAPAATPDGGSSRAPCHAGGQRPLNSYPLTDSGNAEAFAATHAGQVRFDHRLNRWLIRGEHRWLSDRVGEVRLLAREVSRGRLRAAADITDDEQRKAAVKHAQRSESRYHLDAMLALSKSEPAIADAGDSWDTDPGLLGVENGVLDLRTGTLRPGRPDDRITFASPVPYRPDATCRRFDQFLREVFCGDETVISFIQRAVGYSLTGDTSEQALFLLYGSGRNGKSVLLNTLRNLAGDYALNLPFSAFEVAGRSQLSPELALLPWKRLVTSSETNDGVRLNEARIKAMTGGDPITANPKYAPPFEFKPVAKYWLAVNHLPVVRDDSVGFWRRVMLVGFPRAFAEHERDLHLEETLRAELPGILAWAVRGALAWRREELDPPASVRMATESYRSDSDLVADFLEAFCVVGEGLSARAEPLYRSYVAYTESLGMPSRERLSLNAFGRRMTERFQKKPTKTGKFYLGVELRYDYDGNGSRGGDGFDG